MGASPSEPHESSFLTPREQRILAGIEHELSASDALLDAALTDAVRPLPPFLLWAGRASLILIPLILFLPFLWSSSIAAVAGAVLVVKLVAAPYLGEHRPRRPAGR